MIVVMWYFYVKGEKYGSVIYERKENFTLSIVYGVADGDFHGSELIVQYCRQLFCGKNQ